MRLVFVAGMHRSGTSFVTELIHSMGAAVGDDLLSPMPDNPYGFFERRAVKEINDAILSRLGGSWDRPPTGLSPFWPNSAGLDELRRRAEATIAELLGSQPDADVFVVKDPRLSITAPFWSTVVNVDTTVVPVRDPYEVTQSLRHRNGFSPDRVADLWLRYTVTAILENSHPRIVSLQELVSHPDTEVPRLAELVGLPSGIDAGIELVRRRERVWQPTGLFAPVVEHSTLRLACAVFELLKEVPEAEHERTVRPILEQISERWRRKASDDLAGAAGRSSADALAVQLEDANIRVSDLSREVDIARREAQEQRRLVDDRDERLKVLEVARAAVEGRLRDEEVARAAVEGRLRDEEVARVVAGERLEKMRRDSAALQRKLESARRERAVAREALKTTRRERTAARGELATERAKRAEADRARTEAARRAQAAERNFRRLRSRRSVRIATALSAPSRPVFSAVRRVRNRRSARGTSSVAQMGTGPGPVEDLGQRPAEHIERPQSPTRTVRGRRKAVASKPPRTKTPIRKQYEEFSDSRDQATRKRLRAYLETHANLRDRKVTIIMPTYNRAAKIGRAIESVRAQTHTTWELIVIDDGSEDSTPDVLRGYQEREPRIRYERAGRGGVSRARNIGLDLATGDIIAFLDSDNTWDPEFLALMIAALDRNGVEVAYSAMRLLKGEKLAGYRGDRFEMDELRRGNYIDMNVLCHSRRPVDDGLRFDTSIRRTVDWDYLLQLVEGRSVRYIPFLGADYNFHESDDQISNREPRIYSHLVRERYSAPQHERLSFREVFKQHELDFAICLPAPRLNRDEWGDYHFGLGLGQALERRGHRIHMYYRGEPVTRRHEVAISLRGLSGHQIPPGTINIIWNISHPNLLSWEEIEGCDLFFTASLTWPRMLEWASTVNPHVLLQATDRAKFFPGNRSTDTIGEVLFIGNSRNVDRPIVRRTIESGVELALYGTRWEGRVPASMLKGTHVPNIELAGKYSSSRVVLNDHWESMKDFGCVSNRVFDVLGAGGRVLSDHVPSVGSIFADWVSTVRPEDDFVTAVEAAAASSHSTSGAAAWIHEHHSFDSRAAVLLDHIEEFLVGAQHYEQRSLGVRPACTCELRTSSSKGRHADLGPMVLRGRPESLRVGLIPQLAPQGPTSSAFIRLIQPLTSEIDNYAVELHRVDPSSGFNGDGSASLLSSLDALIVSRTAFSSEEDAMRTLDAASMASVPLVLDLDDALHLIDDNHPEFSSYRSRITALEAVIDASAEIWCSTSTLADSLGSATSRAITVGNSIDPRLWRRYERSNGPIDRDHAGLSILYMGTVTHGADFASILPALDELAQYIDFRLTLIGVTRDAIDRPWLTRLRPNSTIYPKFATWLRDQASLFDVGIAPLVSNPFNAMKSDVKLLEYLALGVVPVASAVPPYIESSDLAVGGLCRTSDDWVSVLREFVADRDVLDSARDASSMAMNSVWQNRSAAATGRLLSERLARLTG